MSIGTVRVEWRRGVDGNSGTYIFIIKPTLKRVPPGKRTAIHTVPLRDGVVVQNLSTAERAIEVSGVLISKQHHWDTLETLRNNLINGIGIGPGQLHLISLQRHLMYMGQLSVEGINFEEQERSTWQDYDFTILVPTGTEINVSEPVQLINSDATIV